MKISAKDLNICHVIQPISFCNSIDFVYLNERKSYICYATPVLDYILRQAKLSDKARLFYILADCFSIIAANSDARKYQQRNILKSNAKWQALLNCSKRTLQRLKAELGEQGYFKLDGKTIILTLPGEVFSELNRAPNRSNADQGEFLCKRQELDATKQYIKINIHMLKAFLDDPHLTCRQKLLWLYCFKRSYISFIDKTGDGNRAFLQQQKELADLFHCDQSTISRALSRLERLAYIRKELLKEVVIIDAKGMERFCAPLQLEALFPLERMLQLKLQADRSNLEPLTEEQQLEYGLINQRPALRVVGDYSSTPVSTITNKVDDANLALSNAKMALCNANLAQADAKMAPIYKEVNKNLILKNSIRDPNFGRVVETKNFTDPCPDSARLNKPSRKISSLPPMAVEKDRLGNEVEKSNQSSLQVPLELQREKILQLLQKTKEKILGQREEGGEIAPEIALNKQPEASIAGFAIGEQPSEHKQATAAFNCELAANNILDKHQSYSQEVKESTKTAAIIKFPSSPATRASGWDKEGYFNYDYTPLPDYSGANPLDDIVFANMHRAVCKGLTIRDINLARDYACSLAKQYPSYKQDSLEEEFLYHAATYQPRDFMPKDRVKAALVNAWKLVAKGRWQRSHALVKYTSLAREASRHVEKYLDIGNRAKGADLEEVLADITKIQGYKCTLEGLVEIYNSYQRHALAKLTTAL